MAEMLLSAATVWRTIWSVAAALLILLAMITVHEFGHYVAGKIFKFKIEEFAIGFGPALFRRRKKNGEYFSVRLLPLGGYCAFAGEEEDSGDPGAFNNKKPWQRIIVLIAGALMNFILALVVIVINLSVFGQTMLMTYEVVPDIRIDSAYSFQDRDVIIEAGGRNVYLSSDLMDAVKNKKAGDRVKFTVMRRGEDGKYSKQKIEVILRADADIKNLESTDALYDCLGIARHVTVREGTAGLLETGDRIYKIDGESVYSVEDLAAALAEKNAGDSVEAEIARNNKMQTVTLTLASGGDKIGEERAKKMLGIVADGDMHEIYGTNVKFGFFETVGRSFAYAFRIAGTIFTVLGQLLTGKLGFSSLGGPVTTVTMTSQLVAAGWNSFFEITAFIGVNLAVFNLLPIPALDGSKVVFTTIEWIRGKPISRKVEGIIHAVGFIFLIGFALLVDLLHLF